MENIFSRIDLLQMFPGTNLLTVKPMADNLSDWSFVIHNTEYAPVAYLQNYVEYQNLYIETSADTFFDLSVVIYYADKPIAIWPIALWLRQDKWICGSNAGEVCAPCFSKDCSEKNKKVIIDQCIEFVEVLCKLSRVTEWKSSESVGLQGVSVWHRKIMEKGAKLQVTHEVCADLTYSMEQLRKNMRKSYKSLFNMGEKLWKITIYEEMDQDVFNEFRELHYSVAGRVTRSIATWKSQEKAISDKDAFLVILRNDENVMVGGGLFYISQNEGLYAVGVYKRELFDLPLGHIVQLKAIERMKYKGVQWYKIGARPYSGDMNNPTQKEIAIGYFKEGFSTHMILSVHATCDIM